MELFARLLKGLLLFVYHSLDCFVIYDYQAQKPQWKDVGDY
jgi:hypothetical protein